MDKQMEPKCGHPAEPATHPLARRAVSAQSWSHEGTALHEGVCWVRKCMLGQGLPLLSTGSASCPGRCLP